MTCQQSCALPTTPDGSGLTHLAGHTQAQMQQNPTPEHTCMHRRANAPRHPDLSPLAGEGLLGGPLLHPTSGGGSSHALRAPGGQALVGAKHIVYKHVWLSLGAVTQSPSEP